MAAAAKKTQKPKASKAAAKGAKGNVLVAQELRARQAGELQDELIKLRREQFNLRMGEAAGQPPRPDQWAKVRKNIARIKTVMGEKRTSTSEKR